MSPLDILITLGPPLCAIVAFGVLSIIGQL